MGKKTEITERARKRAADLNAAEEQAWASLSRAVDQSVPWVTRRREAEFAAALFGCVEAIIGRQSVTFTPPGADD